MRFLAKLLKATGRAVYAEPTEAGVAPTDSIVTIDQSVRITEPVTIDAGRGGRIEIGRNSVISPYSMLLAHGGTIVIGEHCTINPFSVLYGHGGLYIGNYVRIATHCVFIPANHVFDDADAPIARQGLTKKGIHVGDDVWFGAGCRILDGVSIGDGAVIGAGAVVNRAVPSRSIFAGVPAKQIGTRDGSPVAQ